MFFVSTNFTTSGIVKDSYAFFTTCSKSSFDKTLQRMDTKMRSQVLIACSLKSAISSFETGGKFSGTYNPPSFAVPDVRTSTKFSASEFPLVLKYFILDI